MAVKIVCWVSIDWCVLNVMAVTTQSRLNRLVLLLKMSKQNLKLLQHMTNRRHFEQENEESSRFVTRSWHNFMRSFSEITFLVQNFNLSAGKKAAENLKDGWGMFLWEQQSKVEAEESGLRFELLHQHCLSSWGMGAVMVAVLALGAGLIGG